MRLTIHPGSPTPVFQQICTGIAERIRTGELVPGQRLPTIRELAVQLVVNPNTVARAYRELEQEGLVASVVGRGTFVAGTGSPPPGRRLASVIADLLAQGTDPEAILRQVREILSTPSEEAADAPR